jgi:hypothetical protein
MTTRERSLAEAVRGRVASSQCVVEASAVVLADAMRKAELFRQRNAEIREIQNILRSQQ